MTNVFIATIPFIKRGCPYCALIVGLPITPGTCEIVPELQSQEDLLEMFLDPYWGKMDVSLDKMLPACHPLGKGTELNITFPAGYRYGINPSCDLESWDEINELVEEVITDLTEVVTAYRTLQGSKPEIALGYHAL